MRDTCDWHFANAHRCTWTRVLIGSGTSGPRLPPHISKPNQNHRGGAVGRRGGGTRGRRHRPFQIGAAPHRFASYPRILINWKVLALSFRPWRRFQPLSRNLFPIIFKLPSYYYIYDCFNYHALCAFSTLTFKFILPLFCCINYFIIDLLSHSLSHSLFVLSKSINIISSSAACIYLYGTELIKHMHAR
jgi:hypothetical protein